MPISTDLKCDKRNNDLSQRIDINEKDNFSTAIDS